MLGDILERNLKALGINDIPDEQDSNGVISVSFPVEVFTVLEKAIQSNAHYINAVRRVNAGYVGLELRERVSDRWARVKFEIYRDMNTLVTVSVLGFEDVSSGAIVLRGAG